MRQFKLSNGEETKPQTIDVKNTFIDAVGVPFEILGKENLIHLKKIREKIKLKLIYSLNIILPFGLVFGVILCLIFSFKTNDIALSECAKASTVILLLLAIKFLSPQNTSRDDL